MEVPIGEVQQRFKEAIEAAGRGETIVITHDGSAVFQLVPTEGRHPGRVPDPFEAADTKRELGFSGSDEIWPAEFDDSSLSRAVLGLE